MIHRTAATWQAPAGKSASRWQNELADLIRSPQELIALLELDPAQLPAALAASQDFALRVPRAFVERMRKGDLGEADANPHPGLIHKYHGRVLLIVSGGCAINCRYCFRRHFPYADNNPGRARWQEALDYIAADPSITEVIYSGGDPLNAPDRQLAWLTERVAAIPHVKRLRVHSRLPIVLPNRIDDDCLDWLTGHGLHTTLVIHSNHPRELDDSVGAALGRLRRAGITLLNQAVLLRGINDQASTLAALSEGLFDRGVLPYYLHLLDPVAGAHHFDVPEAEARALMDHLRARLPGYLVPRLVREIAGEPNKTPIA